MKNTLLLLLTALVFFTLGIWFHQQDVYARLKRRVFGAEPVQFAIKPEQQGKLQIFILAGQSNMEGDGDMKNYLAPDTRGRVYVFDEQYNWQVGKEPVRTKVGPSIAFAVELLEADPAAVVGLINCARGGTNIGQWQRQLDENALYAKMMKRAKAASVQGEIRGVLFFQGENDTEGDPTDHPHEWKKYFEQFVADVRSDLQTPDLPVVFAQLGRVDKHALWEVVKRQQAQVNASRTGMIRTDDLAYQEGGIHYTTESYVEIGKRFAHKYWEIVRRP